MDEQDFHLLRVLARTRNITHAADELYITQSSISKRIRQMERELGVTLLLRSRQGIQFTAAGETVLTHTRGAARALHDMRQALIAQSGTIAGTLHAGVSINYAVHRLPSQLDEYNRLYPDVDTQITTANSHTIYSMLLANKVDVAIARGEHDEWRGKRILLGSEHVCAILNKKDADVPLASLPQISRQADPDLDRSIAQWLRENRIPPSKNRIRVNSTSTCVAMVERGLGWGIVPEICLAGFDGVIRPLRFADGEPLLRATYILFFPEAIELPQVRVFVDLIRRQGQMDAIEEQRASTID